MTRSKQRQSEDRDAFRNDNPDPRMRPVYSALVTKLRQMKSLEDPSMAQLVIDDMIYHRFIFQAKHPDALWYLLRQVHSYWLRSLPDQGSELAQIDFFPKMENSPILDLNEDASQKVEIGFSVDFDDKELKKVVREQIALHTYEPGEDRRSQVELPRCRCGRQFDLFEEWANHARSVIWKVMRESTYITRDNLESEEDSDQAHSTD